MRRASLRAFSPPSWSPTGDASTPASDSILPSISLICSALAVVCCNSDGQRSIGPATCGRFTSWFFMRTARAPTIALSGRNISEDSFAISTAILAPAYAVFQPDSPDDPGSFGAVSKGSQDGEPIDNAMTPDEAASILGSLVRRGWIVASSFFMSSMGVGGRPVVGVADGDFLRKWCMVGGETTRCRTPLPPLGGRMPLPWS